ncbi:MAG: NAD-dependent protein deacylase [Clostridia bacterium]|nr:NAD-dependent protein deacylase [Clostridia bacterium]
MEERVRPEGGKEMTLQEIVDGAKRVVFFGGAGVSTASGIPDFRSAEGLYAGAWRGYPPEEILSVRFFYLHPEEFFDYYRSHMLFPDAVPNAAHRFLADLERTGKLRGIVTQNVDGLHRAAGNRLVYELHGSVRENTCLECGASYSLEWLLATEGIPRCDCGGAVRPGITLYGEALNPYVLRGARREIAACDTLIVAGTSLSVEPAASLLDGFRGRCLVVINRDPTPADARADLVLRGDAAEILAEVRA